MAIVPPMCHCDPYGCYGGTTIAATDCGTVQIRRSVATNDWYAERERQRKEIRDKPANREFNEALKRRGWAKLW